MALSRYKPATKNANRHTARGLKALSDSMRAVGYTEPMVAAADGEMLSGSARIETVADVFGVEVEPIVVESDGTRPIIHVRTDIPNAHTKAAQQIALHANRIAQIDLDWDVPTLASFDADVLGDLWTPAELSDLGEKWAGVIGDGDRVDKDDRAGSSPWDRVNPSGKVRCLIGDLEFGVLQAEYDAWLESMQVDGVPRETAEQWFSQHSA